MWGHGMFHKMHTHIHTKWAKQNETSIHSSQVAAEGHVAEIGNRNAHMLGQIHRQGQKEPEIQEGRETDAAWQGRELREVSRASMPCCSITR